MGWCEENGKRPKLVPRLEGNWPGFIWFSPTDLDCEPENQLPFDIYDALIGSSDGYYAGTPIHTLESLAISRANTAAIRVALNRVRRQSWVALSHATAAKFSNHVRLATAGLDAS